MPNNTISMEDLKPLVAQAASEFDIPEDSIWRKVRGENSGSPEGAANLKNVRTDAVSPKNAKGIMQVTQVALDDVMNAGLIPQGTSLDSLAPADQVRVGAAYIKQLRNYSTDPAVEDAMYNFGPKARFRMDSLPEETSGYLKKTGASMADGSNSTPAPSSGGRFDSSSLLSSLLGNNEAQNANIKSGADEVGAVLKQREIKQAAAISGEQSAIAGAADVAGQQAQIAYQSAALGEQLQRAFNLDPAVAGNEIATSLADAESAKKARVGARAEYDSAASVGILDNPLEYLVNQIKLPQLAAKNNALADQEDVALDNVRSKISMLAAAKSTLVANTADQVKQVSLDQAKVNQNLANSKVNEEEAKNLSATATGKLQLIALTDKMGDNARQTIGNIISLQDREDQRSFVNSAKKEADAKKKLDQDDEDRLNGRLKLVSDSLGLAEPVTLKRLRQLSNPKEKEAWLSAATTGVMGEDLQDSLRFYLSNGSRVGITSSGGASTFTTAKKLEDAGAAYQSIAERANAASVAGGGKRMTTTESRTAGYKMYQDSIIASTSSPTEKTDLSSSQWDKTFNPYKAPFKGFNAAIATMPQLAGLKTNLVTTAVQNLVSTDAVRDDNLTADQQQAVFSSIVKQVQQKQITPAKAAADISVYLSAASAWNRQANGYTLFALPIQDSYLFTLDGELGVDRRKTDLMNPSSVENSIMKRVIGSETKVPNYATGSLFGV